MVNSYHYYNVLIIISSYLFKKNYLYFWKYLFLILKQQKVKENVNFIDMLLVYSFYWYLPSVAFLQRQ